jgi:hypothetical protein
MKLVKPIPNKTVMCNIATEGYEEFALENDQNGWVVVPKRKATKQQTKQDKKDKPVWKKKAPPVHVKPIPTEIWKMVSLGKIVYPRPGYKPLSQKEQSCIQWLEDQYEKEALKIWNEMHFPDPNY